MADEDDPQVPDPIPGNVGEQPFGPEGWSWFDRTEAKVKDAREEETGLSQADMRRLYQRVFGTKQGSIVLADLMRFVEVGATFDPSLGFYKGAAFGFYREGQNSMALYVKRMAT